MKALKLIAKTVAVAAICLLFLLIDGAFSVRDLPGGEQVWNHEWARLGEWAGAATGSLLFVRDARHLLKDIKALLDIFRR